MASYRREALNYTKPDVAIHVRTDLSPHCKGTLDTNFMHQLMMHLLKNAAVHTTQGDIVVRYGYERKGIKVAISYTGIGQAEMVGTDIYAFLQKENALANVNESSALGLATCKAIVEVLGGEFNIETEANSKTVATFWFPCKMRDKRKDLYMI
jgi:signal transduction histidine kinase